MVVLVAVKKGKKTEIFQFKSRKKAINFEDAVQLKGLQTAITVGKLKKIS